MKKEFDETVHHITQTVHIASESNGKIAFTCLKITGLAPSNLLKRMTLILKQKEKDPSVVLPWESSTSSSSDFSSSDLEELKKVYARMDQIVSLCREKSVKVLIDAEETFFQAAIDYIVLTFAKKYNTEQPIIYNTYQMYLKDGLSRLRKDLEFAKANNFYFGVKLVRGAYMESERTLAKNEGRSDPIQPNIEATHEQYNTAIKFCFQNINNMGIFIASHNENSVQIAYQQIQELNLFENNHIHFGQLYGMADHISLTCGKKKNYQSNLSLNVFLKKANEGLKICKYLPFGPVRKVMPYLLRRINENKFVIGRTSEERKLLWKEIKRRWGLNKSSNPSVFPINPQSKRF